MGLFSIIAKEFKSGMDYCTSQYKGETIKDPTKEQIKNDREKYLIKYIDYQNETDPIMKNKKLNKLIFGNK